MEDKINTRKRGSLVMKKPKRYVTLRNVTLRNVIVLYRYIQFSKFQWKSRGVREIK